MREGGGAVVSMSTAIAARIAMEIAELISTWVPSTALLS